MAVTVSRYLTRELKIKVLQKQANSSSQCQRNRKCPHLSSISPKINITCWPFVWSHHKTGLPINQKLLQNNEIIYAWGSSLSLEKLGHGRAPSMSFLPEVQSFSVFIQNGDIPWGLLLCIHTSEHMCVIHALSLAALVWNFEGKIFGTMSYTCVWTLPGTTRC